jgi:hypothetical protein
MTGCDLSTEAQELRLNDWLASVKQPVVIEIGGTAKNIPTVRNESIPGIPALRPIAESALREEHLKRSNC